MEVVVEVRLEITGAGGVYQADAIVAAHQAVANALEDAEANGYRHDYDGGHKDGLSVHLNSLRVIM